MKGSGEVVMISQVKSHAQSSRTVMRKQRFQYHDVKAEPNRWQQLLACEVTLKSKRGKKAYVVSKTEETTSQ